MEVKREKKGRCVTSAGDKRTWHLGWKTNENTNTMKLADI